MKTNDPLPEPYLYAIWFFLVFASFVGLARLIGML